MIRRPPRSTLSSSSAASDVYKRQTSVPVKEKPNFRIFRRLAPNMTGIPRKKVNSAATVREVPARIPPIMVEPERDVPGTTESTWNRPMMNAVLNDRFSRFVQVGLLLLL